MPGHITEDGEILCKSENGEGVAPTCQHVSSRRDGHYHSGYGMNDSTDGFDEVTRPTVGMK